MKERRPLQHVRDLLKPVQPWEMEAARRQPLPEGYPGSTEFNSESKTVETPKRNLKLAYKRTQTASSTLLKRIGSAIRDFLSLNWLAQCSMDNCEFTRYKQTPWCRMHYKEIKTLQQRYHL